MARDDRDSPTRSAEELFADFIDRREGGEDVTLEDLCGQYPDHSVALQRLFAEWEHMQDILRRLRETRPRAGGSQRELGPWVDLGETAADEAEERGGFASEFLERLASRTGGCTDPHDFYPLPGPAEPPGFYPVSSGNRWLCRSGSAGPGSG